MYMWLVFLEMQSSDCLNDKGPACFWALWVSVLFPFFFLSSVLLAPLMSFTTAFLDCSSCSSRCLSLKRQHTFSCFPFGVKWGWSVWPLSPFHTPLLDFSGLFDCSSAVLTVVSWEEFPCLQLLLQAHWCYLEHSVSSLGHATDLESVFLPIVIWGRLMAFLLNKAAGGTPCSQVTWVFILNIWGIERWPFLKLKDAVTEE